MTTTTEQMRAWRGPALFTYGFRPFFLGATVWAALAMALWIVALSGGIVVPSAFDPVSWHAHEFLYGYLSAVIAGFLTTAVPNWTGRMPIVGRPLAALFVLWVAGRAAVAFSGYLSPTVVVVIDLAFPVIFGLAIAREIVAGKNWRNTIVLAMLTVFTLGNALFHYDAAHGIYAAQGPGLRLGLAAALMMIALIGGRVVPSFTRNWLVKQGDTHMPVPPMRRLDKVAMLVLLIALALWVVAPIGVPTAAALALAGVLHFVRLARWRGMRTLAEPLVGVLHAAYACLPLGALSVAVEAAWPGTFGPAAQHLWMAGAIGLMTLAVMTRATLGHTGQALHAGPGTVLIYLFLIAAVVVRLWRRVCCRMRRCPSITLRGRRGSRPSAVSPWCMVRC